MCPNPATHGPAPADGTALPTAGAAPSFRALTEAECMRVLARNTLGRLAFSHQGRVDIQPIHFVHEDNRLYGRTSAGAKVQILRHNPWVAFEIDETRGTFDWRSVVVHGTFYPLPADGSPQELHARQHALELLQRVVPETATDADPVPFRDVVFEIAIDAISGREATPAR